jgi:hypothetical protein
MPSGELFTSNTTFWVGPPSPNELNIYNSNYYPQKILVAGENNVLWVDVSQEGSNAEITDYDWDFSSGRDHFEVESNEMVSVVWVPNLISGYETIFVRGENVCGEGQWHYETFEIVQNYYFSIYPNPANDFIELSIESGEKVQDKTSKVKIEKVKGQEGFGEYTMEIWSEKSGKLKSFTSKELCQQVSIRDLPMGKYFVNLIVNGKTYKQQLFVAK